MSELVKGQFIGDYVLEAQLGKGGFSTVWQARHKWSDYCVAIKILHDPSRVDLLQSEYDCLNNLSHNGITKAIRIDVDHDPPYLLTELHGVQNLRGLIDSGTLSLSPERIKKIFRQLVEAIAHAHENGVVHGDLKPENVLIDHLDKVKLTDFGLSTAVNNEVSFLLSGTFRTEEASKGFAGTLAYMAPEQHEGKAPDARSDVFSLGIILHELVTGNRPQPGDDPRDHFSNPPDWLDVWEECFTHRDKRYENAGKIVADLDWFDFNDYGGKAENKANGWTAEEIEREARAATEPTSGQVLSSVFLWVLAAVHIVPALVFLMSGQIVGLPIAMAAIYAAVSGWTVMSLGAKKREKWIESNLNILPGETRRDKLAWLVSREIPRVSQAAGNLLSQENDFFVTDASQVALRDSSEYYSRVKNTTRTIVPAETEPAVESMQEEQPGSDNPLLELKYGIIPRTWFKEEFNKRINKNVVALECANEKKSYLFEPEIETPELLTEPEVLSEIDLIKEEIDEVETEEIVIPKRAVLDDVIAGLQGTTTVNGGEIFISAGDWIEDEKVVEME